MVLQGNDSLLPPGPEFQAVPIDRYKTNLKRLVASAPKETPVIVITPPPFCAEERAKFFGIHYVANVTVLERSFEHTQRYARAALDVVEEMRAATAPNFITSLDAHSLLTDKARAETNGDVHKGLPRFLCDGVHLSGDGYKVGARTY